MPRIYPDGGTAEIGQRSWQVEWWTVKPGAKDEIDFDSDLNTNVARYPNRAIARRNAWKVAGRSFFGAATLQEQVCEWFTDGLAEWNDVGEPEEVTHD